MVVVMMVVVMIARTAIVVVMMMMVVMVMVVGLHELGVLDRRLAFRRPGQAGSGVRR